MKTKNILIILFASISLTSYAQRKVLINENFAQKMMDLKDGWSDFDMPTKVNGHEARFSAYQCKYYSEASPTKPCECSKGYICIETSNNEYIPYLELPELPSCSMLKLGIQANSKEMKRTLTLQKLVNEQWITIDEYDFTSANTTKCIMWEPKNTQSVEPVKYRLTTHKYGNVIITDVYAEE